MYPTEILSLKQEKMIPEKFEGILWKPLNCNDESSMKK